MPARVVPTRVVPARVVLARVVLARVVLALGIGASITSVVAARAADDANEDNDSEPTRLPLRGLLSDRFGYQRFEHLLASPRLEDRLLAYAALARQKSPLALEKLREALAARVDTQDIGERLALVRIAARHAAYRGLRGEYARILGEARHPTAVGTAAAVSGSAKLDERRRNGVGGAAEPAPPRGEEPASELLRRVAALALVRYGGHEGEQILLQALRQPGPAARAAALAFSAYPNRALGLLDRDPRTLTAEELGVLASRRSPRLEHVLRRVVVESPPALEAQALLALHHLKDDQTAAVAAYWLGLDDCTDQQRHAALEILATTSHPDWPRRAREGLASTSDRRHVLELLVRAPIPSLVDDLGALVDKAPSSETATLVTAIARAQSGTAVSLLSEWLRVPRLAPLAALSLSELDLPAAERALRARYRDPSAARWALRAAVLRAHRRGDDPHELEPALSRLQRSQSLRDRIDSEWASAILGSDSEIQLPAVPMQPRIDGTALALPLLGEGVRQRAAQRIEGTTERAGVAARVAVLGDDAAMKALSQSLLEELLATGGGLAEIVVTELVRRMTETDDDRAAGWFTNPDPWFRIRVAKGLGTSRTARASALLEAAYAKELDASVREAITEALGNIGRNAPFATLEYAEALDPSPEVREAANRARRGVSAPRRARQGGSAWLALVILAAQSSTRGRGSADTLIRTPSGDLYALAGSSEALAILTAVPPEGYAVKRLGAPGGEDNRNPPPEERRRLPPR